MKTNLQSILKWKRGEGAEADIAQYVPFENHVSAVQFPPDTKAINTLVRLGLVMEFHGKYATNHKRSQFHEKKKWTGRGKEMEQYQRAENYYLNIRNQENLSYK